MYKDPDVGRLRRLEYSRKRLKENPELVRATQRKHYRKCRLNPSKVEANRTQQRKIYQKKKLENPELLRAASRERYIKNYSRNKEGMRDYTRNRARQKAMRERGITVPIYNALLFKQNFVCGICQRPETARHQNSGRIRELSIDHDHETGKTRGLLCRSCNLALGNLNDSIPLLLAAVDYLKSFQLVKRHEKELIP